jgi:hypothetical protein
MWLMLGWKQVHQQQKQTFFFFLLESCWQKVVFFFSPTLFSPYDRNHQKFLLANSFS